ncbi:MAG: hypothetical protein KDD32_02520 [Bacteroidetes bacterium]|nr:hypothetical protein [Bacteroidota bacterium]
MKNIILTILLIAIGLTSCINPSSKTVQIGENTFVHNDKVYRIIDNQITELGNMESDSITKSTVLNPNLKFYGEYDLDYVKRGASTDMSAVYRGDVLYFKLDVEGLNDLHDNYYGGGLTINFLDDYNFQIHSIFIEISDLTRIVDSNNSTLHFEYNGKTQMSAEVYKAISDYSVSSSLR